MLRKIITITMIAILLLTSSSTYAATSQNQDDWKDSLSQLKLIGVVDETDLNLRGNITREVFSKIIVNSTGNYDLAKSLSGSTTFSDVSTKSEYVGYINGAVNKGYLSALADGKFEPNATLNFAQLCTAMVRALGYTGSDIVGSWPNGYIDKAKSLGLSTGYNFKSTDAISTTAVIIMIDRMLNTNIKKNSSQEADITLEEAAGILDDQNNVLYSKPEVAFDFNPSTKKLGDIKFKDDVPILRNTFDYSVTPATSLVGEVITINDIKDKDVIYEVYNRMNVLMYYLVVDNNINGQITSILPNKYSPKTIQINNVNYDLGEDAKISKFDLSTGAFNVGDDVTVVLGHDGKIVDTYHMQYDDNGDYAFVVDTSTTVSTNVDDYGKVYYTVKLMHVDGTVKTYKIKEYPNQLKWKLVKYCIVEEDTVELLKRTYMTDSAVLIDRYEKKVGNSYTSDNIKVFNYTNSSVKLINFKDIPNGNLSAGKVKFIGTTGDFSDVNVILTNDIFDEQTKNFVVETVQVPDGKRITEYKYGLISGTNKYTYTSKNEIPGAVVGSVVNMEMYNNNIVSFNKRNTPDGQGWYIQAIDSKRIKMNDWVYKFNPEMSIYIKDYSGNLVAKNIEDINIGTNSSYASIKIYCDRPINNGGKVQTIIISYN